LIKGVGVVEGTFTPISADLVIYYLQFIIDYCSAVFKLSVAEQRTPSHGDLFKKLLDLLCECSYNTKLNTYFVFRIENLEWKMENYRRKKAKKRVNPAFIRNTIFQLLVFYACFL